MALKKNGTLVRTNLTHAEYVEIRKKALDKGVTVSQLTGDALRRGLLKGRAA